MARSATFSSPSFGREPLAQLEWEQANASGKKPSLRERSEMGNRPLSDAGRRTPALESVETWSPARQAAESLFTGSADERTAPSPARVAAEKLFAD